MVDMSGYLDRQTLQGVFQGKLLVSEDVHSLVCKGLEERLKCRDHVEPYIRACLRKLGHSAILCGERRAKGRGISFWAYLDTQRRVEMELFRRGDHSVLMLGPNNGKGEPGEPRS